MPAIVKYSFLVLLASGVSFAGASHIKHIFVVPLVIILSIIVDRLLKFSHSRIISACIVAVLCLCFDTHFKVHEYVINYKFSFLLIAVIIILINKEELSLNRNVILATVLAVVPALLCGVFGLVMADPVYGSGFGYLGKFLVNYLVFISVLYACYLLLTDTRKQVSFAVLLAVFSIIMGTLL